MTNIKSFLATVDKVYPTGTPFESIKRNVDKNEDNDNIAIYNGNNKFAEYDSRKYGAITYNFEDTIAIHDIAHPFDKNNFTFPIKGETVVILKMHGLTFWLPYSKTPYSNYRRDYVTYSATFTESDVVKSDDDITASSYRKNISVPKTTTTKPSKNTGEYNVNEKIKFLNPKQGDTILSGRVGNTIRFSEFFLTEDGKTSSPGIFIRNKQNSELDSKPIGTLIDEDINKDGTSIYITSNKIKVPFKETIDKSKIAFKNYPVSEKLTGNQLFVNSDRIVLSAKASEFIMFGKGNTGIITDGNFSIDAEKEIYIHNNKNITIHSDGSNQIFLNSDNGKVFIGKNIGIGDAGADVQKMVLGGELVKILSKLIDEIIAQQYLTPAGKTKLPPLNQGAFKDIQKSLKTILSMNNYLSKS
jgi:hypothetical protein